MAWQDLLKCGVEQGAEDHSMNGASDRRGGIQTGRNAVAEAGSCRPHQRTLQLPNTFEELRAQQSTQNGLRCQADHELSQPNRPR
jgi:hypothetical protein